jgi:hypothetical protein
MRRIAVSLYSLACVCFSAGAQAQTLGNLLTKDQIYALSVQGFKLDMTVEQTKNILKKEGWEGKWLTPDKPDFNFPFMKGISKLYLLTYESKDHQSRLWSIVEKKCN